MTVFDRKVANDISRGTYAPAACAVACERSRPPQVCFEVHPHRGDVMTARPPGAMIRCELERFDRSWVTIRETDGSHIATVVVVPPAPNDVTEETVAIASALYWSWWRAEEMHGRRHEEVSL